MNTEAFPRKQDDQPGMSLRDYFAGAALRGGVCFNQEDGCIRDANEAARLAYEFADAMLKARGITTRIEVSE